MRKAIAAENQRDAVDRGHAGAVGALHEVQQSGDRRAFGDILIGLGRRGRHIVGDLDVDAIAGGRAIAVDDGDADAVGAIILLRRRMVGAIVGEGIAVGKGAADDRSVGARHGREGGDVERAIGGRDRLRREAAIDDDQRQRRAEWDAVEAVDDHRAHPVGGRHAEAAAVGEGFGRRVRSRRLAGPCGQVILVEEEFGAFRIEAVDRHAVVGAVDRNRQRRRRRVAVAVGDRVSEDLAERLAGRQALHRGVRIVEDIAVAAVGIEGQRAIGSSERAPHGAARDRRHARAVGALGVSHAIGRIGVAAPHARQHIAVRHQRTILGHAIHIRKRRRNIVDDVDDQRVGRDVAVAVGHHCRKAVARIVAGGVRRQRVAVTIAAGILSDRQNAGGRDDRAARGHIDAIDDERGDAVIPRGKREAAGRGFAVRRRIRSRWQPRFIDAVVGAEVDRRRRIVGEGDRHCRRRGVAVAVGDDIGKAVAALFARVGRIGEGAVAVVDDAALCRQRAEHDAGCGINAIGAAHIVGEDVDGDRHVFGGGRAVVVCRRHIVDDRDVEAGVRRRAVAVGHRDRKAVVETVLPGERMRKAVVGERIVIGEGAADHRSVGADDRREAGDVHRAERTRRAARSEDAAGDDLRPADAHIAQPVGGGHGEAAALR